MFQTDWLSQLLQMIGVTGGLEAGRADGVPGRAARAGAAVHQIPFYALLKGQALITDPAAGTTMVLAAGDIVLLPGGAAHVLDTGEARDADVDILCGRLCISEPHGRLMRDYLPATLMVRAKEAPGEPAGTSASNRLASLVNMLRRESGGDKPGGQAILSALTSALFTSVLRALSESGRAPTGLLALAGDARLAPAVAAMFADPARPWQLRDLAALCSMSRGTFVRHFQRRLGRSATALLSDIRIGLAANALKAPTMTTKAAAGAIGYRSTAAFRRAFADKLGMTPGQWHRLACRPMRSVCGEVACSPARA